MPTPRTDLAVSRNPRALLLSGLSVLAVAVALSVWHATSPRALPTTSELVAASTPIGAPVYVGVFHGGAGFDRTLELSGVKVHTTSNTQVAVTPLLCRDGAIAVTTDPAAFCSELIDPAGQPLTAADSIVLEVSGEQAAVAVVDPVRLAFREGLQWATLPAGAGAVVSILPN